MIDTQPVEGPVGVVVSGVDLQRPFDDATAAELRQLLDTHQILVFRAPGADADAHVRLLQVFGPVKGELDPNSPFHLMSNVEEAPPFPVKRLLFHHDFSFTPWPHRLLSLHALRLEGEISPTLYASNERAYRLLTDEQRAAWADLRVMHVKDTQNTALDDDELFRVRLPWVAGDHPFDRYPRTEHPLINIHPRTGRPVLYVNEHFASHVVGVDRDESEAIIQEALAVILDPTNIYTHHWQVGDLVVWDNVSVEHARAAVVPTSVRTLRRVMVNDKSIPEMYAAAVGRPAVLVG